MARVKRVAAGEYALLFGADGGSGSGGGAVRRARLTIALGVVGAAVLWFGMTRPLRADVRELRRTLPGYQAEFGEMVTLYETYQALQAEDRALTEWVEQRPAEFALFAHVTETAQRHGLQLASLRPSARPITDQWQVERVRVELEDVSLPALVAFTHSLTAPEMVVRIAGFELRGGGAGLQVSFEAQTLTARE